MHFETIDPIADPRWEELALASPEATVFHSRAWAAVLRDSYGFKPAYLVMSDGTGPLTAGIPFVALNDSRLVALPFSDVCPPLLASACDAPSEEAEALLSAAKRMTAGGAWLEIRGDGGLNLEPWGFHSGSAFFQHTVDLTRGAQAIEAAYQPAARRAVRKAEREGVRIRVSTAEEDMRAFYRLMVVTRKKQGLIPQPRRFFQSIQRHHVDAGSGYLLLAEHQGQVIAGDLLLRFKDKLVYKFNASDPRRLEVRPNNLLIKTAVDLGQSLGCKMLDLGRCDLDAEGLRRFKLLWGSDESILRYFCYPARPGGEKGGLKGLLHKSFLPRFVHYAPPSLLPLAGAAFYKGFA